MTNNIIKALEAEVDNLTAQSRLTMQHGQQMPRGRTASGLATLATRGQGTFYVLRAVQGTRSEGVDDD